jgi:hypothetical protein
LKGRDNGLLQMRLCIAAVSCDSILRTSVVLLWHVSHET